MRPLAWAGIGAGGAIAAVSIYLGRTIGRCVRAFTESDFDADDDPNDVCFPPVPPTAQEA